jgi:DNA-binding NtrC family response regulator
MKNVLIVDASRSTLLQIQKIVLQEIPDAKIAMAGDGNQALNMIVGGDYNVIITSNQLQHYFGSNLLQAITRGKDSPPTLLHSTHPEGYMDVRNDARDKIDLAVHVEKFFPFATFKIKDRNFSYIPKFLQESSRQSDTLRKDAMKATGGRSHFVS